MRQLYQNRTDQAIKFGIGTHPGKPWTRFDSEPGQTVEGPGVPNYREVFEHAGYTAVTAEEAAQFTSDSELLKQMEAEEAAAIAKAAEDAAAKAKAEADAEAKAAEELAKAEAERAARAVPEPTKAPVVAEPQKGGRRGANRGSTS